LSRARDRYLPTLPVDGRNDGGTLTTDLLGGHSQTTALAQPGAPSSGKSAKIGGEGEAELTENDFDAASGRNGAIV